MPPIRRYVRISPHSCLEVRIFVENPADVTTWLLRPSNPALPRIFTAVRPLILPKLREENERARLTKGKSGKKKKGVKDVVKGDDFEVIVFLTEGYGRHEVVVKRREAGEAGPGSRAVGLDSRDAGGDNHHDPVIIREDDGEDIDMDQIPEAGSDGADDDVVTTRATRRHKATTIDAGRGETESYADEKKKLGFKTRYDGFSIWGKVLCLLVQRKGGPSRRTATSSGSNSAGMLTATMGVAPDAKDAQDGAQQALMQEWISSTQVLQDDDDDG